MCYSQRVIPKKGTWGEGMGDTAHARTSQVFQSGICGQVVVGKVSAEVHGEQLEFLILVTPRVRPDAQQ